jgi:hypothetical protein
VDKPSFEASLRALARRRAQEPHPEPSELAAYHAGELTEDQDEKIQDHLTICEECARLLLGLGEYSRFQPSKDADTAAADQSAAAWQRFQARLREEGPAKATRTEAPAAPVVPLQRRRTPLVQRPGFAWAVAAVLALCVVGLGIRNASLPEQPAEQREPGARQVIYLDPDGDVQRGGEGGGASELPDPTVEEVVYEMPLQDPRPGATYEAEIFAVEQDDQPRRTIRINESDEYLAIGIPRGSLAPGAYRFRVHRIEGNGSKTLVGTYSFDVP